ncbi:GNAT family N-acetyltransferase [Barrientosiimonas marina]|uniref:GNAT family N-acetyltransferase n=1 Tax=Lentibacillus kimchii TaxID=1542911 RepID=A0ABW2UUB2_9BACI
MNVKVVETAEEKQQAFAVRTTVFVDEQQVPADEEIDAYDEEAIHLLGYDAGSPVAVGRVRFADSLGKLERICVLKQQRGQSLGTQMIQAMETIIKNAGYTEAQLNAQTHAIHFYKRLGYHAISEEFMEAGIPHVAMSKQLS